MTVSNTITYNDTVQQIIYDACIEAGNSPEETLSAEEYNFALRKLNRMVFGWQAYDLHLWLEEEAILFLQQGQVKYTFTDTSSGDNCSNVYVQTVSTANAATSATTITLSTVTGMSVSDNIGIVLDSGLMHWAVISNINTGTKVVTFAAALPSAAASGAVVVSYTTKLFKPLRVLQARRYNYASATDVLMGQGDTGLSRADYFALPYKTSPGTVVEYYYDPKRSSGDFYVWPAPTSATDAVKFTYLRQIDDFVNATDTPDLPREWLEPLVYNLAVRLVPSYGLSNEKYSQLKDLATNSLNLLLTFDTEKKYLQLQPELGY